MCLRSESSTHGDTGGDWRGVQSKELNVTHRAPRLLFGGLLTMSRRSTRRLRLCFELQHTPQLQLPVSLLCPRCVGHSDPLPPLATVHPRLSSEERHARAAGRSDGGPKRNAPDRHRSFGDEQQRAASESSKSGPAEHGIWRRARAANRDATFDILSSLELGARSCVVGVGDR